MKMDVPCSSRSYNVYCCCKFQFNIILPSSLQKSHFSHHSHACLHRACINVPAVSNQILEINKAINKNRKNKNKIKVKLKAITYLLTYETYET